VTRLELPEGLVSLDLSCNRIDKIIRPKPCARPAPLQIAKSKLKHLDLFGNAIELDQAKLLALELSRDGCQVESITFGSQMITVRFSIKKTVFLKTCATIKNDYIRILGREFILYQPFSE
jgi:hypothetical protein